MRLVSLGQVPTAGSPATIVVTCLDGVGSTSAGRRQGAVAPVETRLARLVVYMVGPVVGADKATVRCVRRGVIPTECRPALAQEGPRQM
jgi:hypothetical protein